MFEIVVEFPKKIAKWEVNNGTPQVNGGFLLEGNSQELLVQSTSSSLQPIIHKPSFTKNFLHCGLFLMPYQEFGCLQ
jgi:hypothetical protein